MSPKSTTKLLNLPTLLRLRSVLARRRRRVVFTNGVFDILHAGHVEVLEKARSLGDALIVGVNKDASARRLGKGPGRPINKFKDRARVLCALSCVDAVIGFDEDTPLEIIKKLRPNVLVKGADYKKHQVAGAQFAGKVVLVPLKIGYSTTKLISRIRRNS